jgi:hypothetical protein
MELYEYAVVRPEAGTWRLDPPRWQLEIRPPDRMAVGHGNAFVIAGYAYSPAASTRELIVRVGGSTQRVDRFGLPRDDVYRELGEGDPVRPRAYRSGFVSIVRLAPVTNPERHEIELLMSLEGGGEARASAGTIELLPDVERPDLGRADISGRWTPRRDLYGDIRASRRAAASPARVAPRADPLTGSA